MGVHSSQSAVLLLFGPERFISFERIKIKDYSDEKPKKK